MRGCRPVSARGPGGWLRFIADGNLISALTAATRRRFGDPGAPSAGAAWPLAHPGATVLLWLAALLIVFITYEKVQQILARAVAEDGIPGIVAEVHDADGTWFGLSRAVIEHPVIDIEVQLGTGRADITVPRDAIIDIEHLHTGWKDTLYRPRRRPHPGGPTIRISGTMGLGRLRIRHAWR